MVKLGISPRRETRSHGIDRSQILIYDGMPKMFLMERPKSPGNKSCCLKTSESKKNARAHCGEGSNLTPIFQRTPHTFGDYWRQNEGFVLSKLLILISARPSLIFQREQGKHQQKGRSDNRDDESIVGRVSV